MKERFILAQQYVYKVQGKSSFYEETFPETNKLLQT